MTRIVSTYRIQLSERFTLDDAVQKVPYWHSLGLSHLYLSPILQAVPGSTHGYDVVDHDQVAVELGGLPALTRLSEAVEEHGMGLVLDIVPNHMAVPVPEWHNAVLWSVLAQGVSSPHADWFDVDWSAGEGALLMPILGNRIDEVLEQGELTLDYAVLPNAQERVTVLCYHDHRFPVRAGTENLPLSELLERQYYRLAYWKLGNEELNYRRFFDVDTLAAIRVEEPHVFHATHRLVIDWVKSGLLDGLRIDHPDGLAEPGAYLARLAEATDHTWVVVEKILAADELLPSDWQAQGSTGYDSLWRLQGLFADAQGAIPLGNVMQAVAGDSLHDWAGLVETAKRDIITGPLAAEMERLTSLAYEYGKTHMAMRDHARLAWLQCLSELLVATDRYRYYVSPGTTMPDATRRAFDECVDRAMQRIDEENKATMQCLAQLLTGESYEPGETLQAQLMIRFQQTCGAVMAKGVEDTAFYRWTHQCGLCEVGGEPAHFSITPEAMHAWNRYLIEHSPAGMTTLSTHDAKRSEDVRCRLGVMSEFAADWSSLVQRLQQATQEFRPNELDGRTENLLWQTLMATWSNLGSLSLQRLSDYLIKSLREAKLQTSWLDPDESYEAAVIAFTEQVLQNDEVASAAHDWLALTASATRAATLGIKLVQLTMPGIPDVYQGTEIPALTLVDPDNRQPVAFADLHELLTGLDEPGTASVISDDPGVSWDLRQLVQEKLLVCSRALRLRRRHPAAFVGTAAGYHPLASESGHAFGFLRSCNGRADICVVVTRLSRALQEEGGWQQLAIELPEGEWECAFSERTWSSGRTLLAGLLDDLPVALLFRRDMLDRA